MMSASAAYLRYKTNKGSLQCDLNLVVGAGFNSARLERWNPIIALVQLSWQQTNRLVFHSFQTLVPVHQHFFNDSNLFFDRISFEVHQDVAKLVNIPSLITIESWVLKPDWFTPESILEVSLIVESSKIANQTDKRQQDSISSSLQPFTTHRQSKYSFNVNKHHRVVYNFFNTILFTLPNIDRQSIVIVYF